MGIVILIVLTIGAFVIAKFVIQLLFKLIKKSSARTNDYTAALNQQTGQKTVADPAQNHNKVRTMRVGRHSLAKGFEDTPWDDLPKYKGETGVFGLPKYKDVVVPDKHNYATVFYMDGWFRQYVYDVMAGHKRGSEFAKSEGRVKVWVAILFFPLMFILMARNSVQIYMVIGFTIAFFLYSSLWGACTGIRASRRMAEMSRRLTPDDWRQVYDEVSKSQDRVDEMTRAFRSSGIGHRW